MKNQNLKLGTLISMQGKHIHKIIKIYPDCIKVVKCDASGKNDSDKEGIISNDGLEYYNIHK